MNFIFDPHFQHSFLKDVVRIDYLSGFNNQLITDFGYSYIMCRSGDFTARDHKNEIIPIPKVFAKCSGDFFTVDSVPGNSWISFELPTVVFHHLIGESVHKWRNRLLDLRDVLPNELFDGFYQAAMQSDSVGKLAATFDSAFGDHISKWQQETEISKIIDHVYLQNGMLCISDIEDFFCCTKRKLERMFREFVGTSPFRFVRLVRFNFMIRELTLKNIKLGDLILRYNYFDQSHFEKDFQIFTGFSIKDYRNNLNPLLEQALQREYVK